MPSVKQDLLQGTWRYVPRYVAEWGPADEPGVRVASGVALVLDIAGFSALTERFSSHGPEGAEQLSGILEKYFGLLFDIVIAHRGDIDNVVGDALVCVWDCADNAFNAALIAVACGLRLQAAADQIASETGVAFRQRVSVASGILVRFVVGGHLGKWQALAAGAAVMEAVRLNRYGGSEGVVVSGAFASELPKSARGRALQDGTVLVTEVDSVVPPRQERGPGHVFGQGEMTRFLPDPLIAELQMGRDRVSGEFRSATVVFVGFPELADGGAEALDDLHAAVLCAQIAHEELGGVLAQTAVDEKGIGLLCAFGLPGSTREQDAARAVAFARRLSEESRNVGLCAAIGVSTGMVFYADTGNERRRQAKITGGCVNLAARLMVAAREGVLCDEATRRATASSFLFEPVEAVPAKGFADPVVAWRPVRRVAEQRRVFDGKLIGREVEFAQLRGAIDALLAGAGTGLMLRGEAGIGKSRLAADVAGYASACGVRVVWAVGSLLESGTPYYPWRAALRTLLCPLGDFSPDGALFEARRLLADADTLSGWLPLLGDIEPVVHRESLLVNEMTGQARAASLRTLMVELLRRFAVQRPLMVVVEDVHWFDHQSRTLYSHIAQNADPGLLVLGTTRPGDDLYPGTRTGYAGGTRMLEIGPLDREGLAALARDRLGAARVADGLVDFVESASGGNPFYAEQVLLSLRSTGRLARVADGVDGVLDPWMDGGPASGDTAWREMLTSRVDALSSPEKVAIRLAAVIGRSFSEEMLVDLATSISEGTDVVEVIDELVAEDIFRESPAGDGTLDFRHTLLREAMYSQTAYATRKSLHALIAHWIEEHEADRIELRHSELAMHCERAHDLSRAVHHLEQAAAISSLRCASREAISQARRAMELAEEHMLPPDSGRTTRCEAILGDAHNELFQYEAAKHHFKRALASAGRPAPRTTASLLLGIIAQLVVQAGRRLRLWSSEHADPAQSWASRVYQKLGEIAYFDGSNLAVLHATLTSLNLAERSGAVREAVGGLAALAIGFQSVGLRRVSRLYNGRSIDLAERKGGVADVAYAHLVNGVYQAANTDWQAASESLQKAAQHYVTLGAGERWQQAYAGLCAVAVTRGRFEEAHELLRLMQAHQSEMPVQITAYAHAFATCVALAQGGPLEALVAKLREIIRANDLAKIDRMFCQGLIASACWRVGDGPAAIAAARAGLSILETGVPAAWYVTEGLAGIAGTLLEASESGQALAAEGGRALKGLLRYARNNPVASGRAALLGGWDLMQKGHTDRSVARWRQGLEHAQQRGTRYDAALLLSALSSCGALEASEADSLRQCGKELLEELGAVAWIPLCHRTHRS